jgi:hypothetical protein
MIDHLDTYEACRREQLRLEAVSRKAQAAAMQAFVDEVGGRKAAAHLLQCSETYISKIAHGHREIGERIERWMRAYSASKEA